MEVNGTGFFAGNSLSVADIEWYNFMKWHKMGVLDGIPVTCFDKYTNLSKLHDIVANNPKVNEWNETHKK